MTRKIITRFIWPGAVLLALSIAAVHTGYVYRCPTPLLEALPAIVLGLAFLFGWRFNRSRVFFAALVYAMAAKSLSLYALGPDLVTPKGEFVFHAVALLVPLNVLGLLHLKERGMLTSSGISRFSILLLQVPLVVFLYMKQVEVTQRVITFNFFEASAFYSLYVSQATLLVYAVVVALTLFRFVRRHDPLDAAFFWSLVLMFVALCNGNLNALTSFYFSAAGLIMVAGGIEFSHKIAFDDELTGLPARRALDEALMQLNGPYALAMVDIDHFKKFNDTWGHEVGDQVLKKVAHVLARVRGGAKAYRYGGEEFTILLPGYSAEESMEVLEDLREAVEETPFGIREPGREHRDPAARKKGSVARRRRRVTISIGVAEPNDELLTPEDVIRAADKALYEAKRKGRNRVCADAA